VRSRARLRSAFEATTFCRGAKSCRLPGRRLPWVSSWIVSTVTLTIGVVLVHSGRAAGGGIIVVAATILLPRCAPRRPLHCPLWDEGHIALGVYLSSSG
jgi:hypothetical protein